MKKMYNLSIGWRNKMTNYVNYTKEQLIAELELTQQKLKNNKLGLVWDKEKEPEKIVLECSKNLPVLVRVSDKEIVSDLFEDNLIIEGDNYHALTCLNYTHKGKIDVIYIDPPYNTGAKDWKYNNHYVVKDDGYRHSKWLNMMEKRLILAKDLLTDDGIICATIDDYELPNLWLLMNKIFDADNFLGVVTIRNNPKGRMNKRKISQVHEYALYYGKSSAAKIKQIYKNPEEKSHNYIKDEDGNFYLKMNLRKQGVDSEAIKGDGTIRDRYFPIYFDPETGKTSTEEKLPVEILPIDKKGYKRIWRRDKKGIKALLEKNELWCEKNGTEYQVYFKFKGGLKGEQPKSIWDDSTFSASEYGTTILAEILGAREKFPYPKSLPAVKYSLEVATENKNAIILDFFAGSGTTGHAVLEMNLEDEGNRRFILCTNNENNICTEVTYPRIHNVIKGYEYNGKNKKVLYEKKLNVNILTQSLSELQSEIDGIINDNKDVYDKLEKKLDKNVFKIFGVQTIRDKKTGLGGNLQYFKTENVEVEQLESLNDDARKELADKAGEMIAIKEDTFIYIEKNDYYQIFANRSNSKYTAVYFREDLSNFSNLIEAINEKTTKLYIFSFGRIDKRLYNYLPKNIEVEDIPEPIIEIYKEINTKMGDRK